MRNSLGIKRPFLAATDLIENSHVSVEFHGPFSSRGVLVGGGKMLTNRLIIILKCSMVCQIDRGEFSLSNDASFIDNRFFCRWRMTDLLLYVVRPTFCVRVSKVNDYHLNRTR